MGNSPWESFNAKSAPDPLVDGFDRVRAIIREQAEVQMRPAVRLCRVLRRAEGRPLQVLQQVPGQEQRPKEPEKTPRCPRDPFTTIRYRTMNANTNERKTHGPVVRFFRALGHPVIGWLLLSALAAIGMLLMNVNNMLIEQDLKYLKLRNEFDRNLLESQHQIREELQDIRKSLSGTGESR